MEEMPKAPAAMVELPRQLDYVLAIGMAKDPRGALSEHVRVRGAPSPWPPTTTSMPT
jgi:hypothetical protein